jgi:hypothetical protein
MQILLSAAIAIAGSVSWARADDIVRVSMVDLATETHKWEGKTIETTNFCFYADVDEFRCSSPGGARVDFTDIQPEAARKSLESNCDTVSKVLSRACRVKVQFVYDHYERVESGDGGSNPVVFARDFKATVVGK